MTLGTDVSSLVGICGSLFGLIRTETKQMKTDITNIVVGVALAGSWRFCKTGTWVLVVHQLYQSANLEGSNPSLPATIL